MVDKKDKELTREEEWALQWGAETPASNEEPDLEEDDEDTEVDDTSEEEEGTVVETTDEPPEPDEDTGPPPQPKPPAKPSNQDDEYREFIESQPNEELKERARKVVQSLKSAQGRASAASRQLNAREALINQLYAQSGKRAEQKLAPTSSRQPEAGPEPSDELPEKIKALKKKNPQATELIEEIAKHYSNLSAKQMQAMIDSRLGAIEQDKEADQKAAAWQQLESKAAHLFEKDGLTVYDVVRSEDFRAWLQLKKVEEPGVYNLYMTANDPDTAYIVIEKYEREYQEAIREAGGAQPPESQAPTNKGDTIKERRAKTTRTSRTPKPSRAGTPKSNTADLDYKTEWDMMWGSNANSNSRRR